MSSRLMTMKFMQRAAAASPSSPKTPGSDRPSKRQRLSTDAAASPDAQIYQDAIAADEAKKNAILERKAADAGETKWVLSIQNEPAPKHSPLRIVNAGYGAIDSGAGAPDSEDEEETNGMQGRRSFGRFNKTVERQQNPDFESSSESESGSGSDSDSDSSDDSGDEGTADHLIKASRKEAAQKLRVERKEKKKQEAEKARILAERRRSKEVNLNKVGGISNASIQAANKRQGQNSSNLSNMACHQCGQKGHLRKDCPDTKQRRKDRS